MAKKKRQLEKLFKDYHILIKARVFSLASKVIAAFAIIFFIISYSPSVVYNVLNKAGIKLNTLAISETASRASDNTAYQVYKPPTYQPPYDPSLTDTNTLVIKSAGISTNINEAPFEDYESALRKGAWRVPDFGTPYSRDLPTIITAHRYGYLAWSISFRLRNSFYNLPKLKIGDTVEIIWQQRRYVYEIYADGKGEEITDYKADLILYTCQDLNSPIRIFKYGRLLKI